MEVKRRSNRFLFQRIMRQPVQPLAAGWKGASFVLFVTSSILVFFQSIYFFGERGVFDFTAATLILFLAIGFGGGLLMLLFHGIKKMPSRYLWAFSSSFLMLFFTFMGPLEAASLFVLSWIIMLTLWGALFHQIRHLQYASRGKKIFLRTAFVLVTACIALTGFWTIRAGDPAIEGVTLKDLKTSPRYANHQLPNPATAGEYAVKTITYGSKNSYRKEFNRDTSLLTEPVDASPFVKNWSSLRDKTFGFGPKELPLNATVWYPEGKGPFPLVLIVHGDHLMTDYSDPGYEYLGKLLASRGYIVASIDENFLNVSPYDDLLFLQALEDENPARAILLLEHLKTWEGWNKDIKNPFYQKVEMSNIALIGHSRGGEAISLAAAFNQLSLYPDNAAISFDYHFDIKTLISIAGTDSQYRPSGKPVHLQNVNYLALHGAHDMDVNTFDGSRQYHRITFTEKKEFMKASVYIYGANHGQFNQAWSRGDGVGLGNRLFNLKQLISRKDQENVAKVLISAFLDSTLQTNKDYSKVFKDIGYAQKWLPNTMYVSNYRDAKTTILASFEEDIDLKSTTITGGEIQGKHLKEWKEERIQMKYDEAEDSAARVSWDRSKNASIASFTIIVPETGAASRDNRSIIFSLADTSKRTGSSYHQNLVDLTIKVEDTNGQQARLPLSHVSKLVPKIEGKLLKWPFSNFGSTSEPVFQNYEFVLEDFQQVNPLFSPSSLKQITFDFDRTKDGTIFINDVGVR